MRTNDLAHISQGRIPWRPWVQLRDQPAYPPTRQQAPPPLGEAARSVEPPGGLVAWQRQDAQHRLMILCDWLERHLSHATKIEQSRRNTRQISVLGCLAYVVDYDARRISAGLLEDGHLQLDNGKFEVARPLITPMWLMPALRNLGLIEPRQGELFFDASAVDELANWLVRSAYGLLLKNPEFRNLRRNALPKLFQLPEDIFGIALASRYRPVGPLLDSITVNDVWRNDRAFRRVARENPQLLPLLLAYIKRIPAGQTVHTKDPVLAIKTVFRESGLSEAAWRYVVRHGSRIFKVAWEITQGQRAFEVAVRYLSALESAGLPPPPPPSVVKAFIHAYCQHQHHHARIRSGFHAPIDPVALRAGFLEANRRRQDGNLKEFTEEFLGVCWWSEALPVVLDANQMKAGWRWFVRRWREDEEEEALLARTESQSWITRLEGFRTERMDVVPIRSSGELLRESRAMRNCLESYLSSCARGNFEVYSVRDAMTGKRKGCIGFRIDDDGSATLQDVKGFANTPPSGEVEQIARILLGKLRKCAEWPL